jgi:hypothetical protein
MLQFILRRLALLVPVLLGVSIISFSLIRLIPGDATMLMIGADRSGRRRSSGQTCGAPTVWTIHSPCSTANGWDTCSRGTWASRSEPAARDRGVAAAAAGHVRADAARRPLCDDFLRSSSVSWRRCGATRSWTTALPW